MQNRAGTTCDFADGRLVVEGVFPATDESLPAICLGLGVKVPLECWRTPAGPPSGFRWRWHRQGQSPVSCQQGKSSGGLHGSGVLRAVRGGRHRGAGGEPGARQGDQGGGRRPARGTAPSWRSCWSAGCYRGPASRRCRCRRCGTWHGTTARRFRPAPSRSGGRARHGNRHHARLGCLRHYRHRADRDDRGAGRRRAARRGAGGPGRGPGPHRGEAGGPVDGAGRPGSPGTAR
jgi:hypothetical protein